MAKTKEELIEMIENDLVDSTSQKITGNNVKNVMLEMVETISENAGSGGTMEYWSMPDSFTTDAMQELIMFFLLCKIQLDDMVVILGASYQFQMLEYDLIATAIAWDPNAKMYINEELTTPLAFLEQTGVTSLADFGFTQITEEEFYTV